MSTIILLFLIFMIFCQNFRWKISSNQNLDLYEYKF